MTELLTLKKAYRSVETISSNPICKKKAEEGNRDEDAIEAKNGAAAFSISPVFSRKSHNNNFKVSNTMVNTYI